SDVYKRQLEELLKKRDRELDLLGGELNRDLSALRGRREVAGFRRAEAQRSLVRVSALGGVCPTCERPLEEQRDLLVEKYEQAMQRAEEEIADLESRIKAQSERIEEVSRRRSGLRKEFEDLNERKSRRSGLQAGLRSLVSQISEAGSEIQDLCQRIEELGEDRFDQKRLEQVEASLRQLAPLVQEIGALEVRLGDLPRLEAERAALEGARAAHEGRALRIEGEIRDLGYDEKEHDRTRGLLAELRPIHERFLAVRERVQQIPSLEGRVSMQREEIERLARAIDLDRRALEILDFDPAEHRALLEESRSLSRVEKEAQRLRIILAAEPDIQRRLEEASKALASLESDLASTIDGLQATGYSQRAHEEARQALAEAERMADVASKEAFRWRESLGVLKDRIRRLQEASERRRGHERALSEVARRMEVVEATRTLVNMFMDGVLVRIRSEIARTAGEILDEVSGKYSLIKIDDDFNILVEDGGEYYPISRYSGGEIDMIAVSVRVAISEYLMRFGQERSSYSFLILDEIFGSQDPEHREKLIQMLRSLEDRFPQIIAISHISDVQGQFDNILQVVEDESGNSRVEAL
ncbi:MAG: hypothetical protein QUS08_08325, partial [Methanothrix sp.]|nr:hypothetical protein [Methanothrix sp.]